jgi:hypothetical protein
MYQQPTNMEELSRVIRDLDMKAASQRQDISDTASRFMVSLKPINLLKNAIQPVTNGPVGKLAGKLLLGYRKLVYRRAHAETPMQISNG